MSNVTQTGAVGEVVVTQTGQEAAVTVVTARGPAGSTTVDQTIIDGSTNAVSGNAVFDGLALKAPIANPTFTGIVTAPRITGRCDGLEVFCKAGLAISAGQVVYVTGASGNNIIIGLAQANAELTSSKTIGISESTLANNATGYVITEGLLTVSISAPTAVEGDPIWLSPTTAGGMVFGAANKPVAPNHMVYLGVVTRKTGNTIVEIFVKVQNGSELDELSDVLITSPTAGQALMRGASLWENRSLVSADISDATANATPNTIVKRGSQGGAFFAGTSSIAVSASTTTATAVSAVSTSGTAVYGESGSSDGGFFGSVFGTGLSTYTDAGDYHAKFGDSSGDNRSFVARVSGAFGWWRGAFRGFLQAPTSITSSDKTWTLPNNTGTVALTTDEMTPTAAGIASKINGATEKTTLVDADETVLTDSEASFGLKKVTWLNVWNYIVTKIGAITSITAGGAWSFSSTTRPTSAAATTSEPTSTSIITRTDLSMEIMRQISQVQFLATPVMIYNSASGGSASSGSEGAALASGTTANAYARVALTRQWSTSPGITGGNNACNVPVAFAFGGFFLAPTDTNSVIRFVVGEVGSGAPALASADALAARGWGFEIYWSTSNSRVECRMFSHNGTTYTTSSGVAITVGTNRFNSFIAASDGAGVTKLFHGVANTNGTAVRPAESPILTHTSPSSGNYGQSFASLICVNSASTAATQTIVRAPQFRVQVGQTY
jgi:hypothetical protein